MAKDPYGPGNPGWKKGQSGNPKGRPKDGESMTAILQKYLDKIDFDNGSGKLIARKEAIADKVSTMAAEGNLQAIQYVFDRMDGRPVTKIGGDGGSPIEMRIGVDFEKV